MSTHNLKELAKKKGLDHHAITAEMYLRKNKVTSQAVYNWMEGKRDISSRYIPDLCSILGCTFEDFFSKKIQTNDLLCSNRN